MCALHFKPISPSGETARTAHPGRCLRWVTTVCGRGERIMERCPMSQSAAGEARGQGGVFAASLQRRLPLNTPLPPGFTTTAESLTPALPPRHPMRLRLPLSCAQGHPRPNLNAVQIPAALLPHLVRGWREGVARVPSYPPPIRSRPEPVRPVGT